MQKPALCSLLLLCACAHGPPRVAPEEAEVVLEVFQVKAGGERGLWPEARLRTGDQVALRVHASHPVYLYAAWVSSDARSTPLFPPPGGEELRPAGDVLRLPTRDGYQLEPPPGAERLVLLAAPRPLLEIDGSQCLRYRLACCVPGGGPGVAVAEAKKKEPPPPPQKPREDVVEKRGERLFTDGQGRRHWVGPVGALVNLEFPLIQVR